MARDILDFLLNLSIGLSHVLLSSLIFPTVPIIGGRHWFMLATFDLIFPCLTQTLCVAEPKVASLSAAGQPPPKNLLTSSKFSVTPDNVSSFAATHPDRFADSMLKHFLSFGTDLFFVLNFSSSLHSISSIPKPLSIIPILKIGKLLKSPAFFPPVPFISCVSKLFKGIVLYRLLIFLLSKSILFPIQAGFRPGRCALDQNSLSFLGHFGWV